MDDVQGSQDTMAATILPLRMQIAEAITFISRRLFKHPSVGIILGSGLGGVADLVRGATRIPYDSIPHFVPTSVEGHQGVLVIGDLGRYTVAIMQGRLHFYEGYTLQQVTFPVRVLAALGCSTLIVTNAAGGLNPSFVTGDLMLITDHINLPGLAGHNPLFGPNDPQLGPRFLDMHNAYDAELRRLAQAVAEDQGVRLQQGVYVALGGPSFETPAEVRLLRSLGGDAVGMSTAAEVIVARHSGVRVLGISLISNVLSDAEQAPEVSHEEVLAAGAAAGARLARLIEGILSRL
jgi:purine-nucleoside phosphorylase